MCLRQLGATGYNLGYFGISSLAKAISTLKSVRDDEEIFQKACVGTSAALEARNIYLGVHEYTKLSTSLESVQVTGIFSPIGFILDWFKPYNIDTIHFEELIQRIQATQGNNRNSEVQLRGKLLAFIALLANAKCGQLRGFKTGKEFLDAFEEFILVNTPPENIANFRLQFSENVNEVPLIKINWVDWLTKKSFQAIGLLTVVSYFNEWNFLSTSTLAAKIGSNSVFGMVNQISFGKAFTATLFTGFALSFASAVRKIWLSTLRETSVKSYASYQAVASLMTAIYFRLMLVPNLANPLIRPLAQVAAKCVGIYCVASSPSLNRIAMSRLEEVKDELTVSEKVSGCITRIFSPLTNQYYVACTLKKVESVTLRLFESFNDFFNYDRDGFDKLYKVLEPSASILNRALQQAGLASRPIFQKFAGTIRLHRAVIYMAKVLNVLPHWLTYNHYRHTVEIATCFYVFDSRTQTRKFNAVNGISTLLLDIGTVFEFAGFLRKNEVYRFDYFVNIGNSWAEKTVPVFGVQVKNVPLLKEINGSVKNIFVSMSSFLRICEQIWKAVVKKDKTQFEFKAICSFAGHIGKITICAIGYSNTYFFDILCLFTGLTGWTFLIDQYKMRQRFRAKKVYVPNPA